MDGMNMGSPDKFSVDNIELNENDGSTFTKVDSNLSERRKGFEGNGHENEASGDRSRMELSPQHHGSSLVQAVARSEELESSYTKSSPQAQCNLYEDIEKTETVEFNRERVHSDHGGETGLTSGEHPDDSSSPTEAGKFHTDIQMDDRAHFLSEFPSKEDSSYPLEDVKKNSPCHEIFLEIPEKVSGNLQLEKSEDVYGVTEEEGTVHLMDKAYGGNWEIEGKDSDVHSLGLSPEMPASPVRETSVSPEQAHNLLGKELSSQNIDGSLCSPKSSRREVSPSPKRTDMDSKIVFSEDHPSPYPRRMSPPIRRSQEESPERTDRDSKIILPEDHPSPRPRQMSLSPNRRSRQESPERTDRDSKAVLSEDHPSPSPSRRSRHESSRRSGSLRNRPSSSPRRRLLSPDRRKPERSLSRSPTRQRGPPYGSRRDYRDRSRSRSPIARDRYRRSPRRYSPRRRSPPGYRSRRRSPRRRPWSPPHSRNNGVGRPGNNLFVAGFSFVTTERDLERKFSRFGRVRDVRIVRDKRSGDSRGFGFLSLERDEDADAAIRALDQTEWNGRVVLVEKSKSR